MKDTIKQVCAIFLFNRTPSREFPHFNTYTSNRKVGSAYFFLLFEVSGHELRFILDAFSNGFQTGN